MPRVISWAKTMSGHGQDLVMAHENSATKLGTFPLRNREAREELEKISLRAEASFSNGAGNREIAEEPDENRTCFERDRDRIVHSAAFRRLAGKTQAVVFPRDHQRTRLTHALEVAQCAVSIAKGLAVNISLTEAIALGHDCGHGPGGHAAEDAFDHFLPQGYDHGPWGANVVLKQLNLCAETLDGIRNHSWSRPAPNTLEGEIVSWADRIAYCAHDLEDAMYAGIVSSDQLPDQVREVCGTTRRQQLNTFIRALVDSSIKTAQIGMDKYTADALAALREFNYINIYTREDSLAQSATVVKLLVNLVEYYCEHPDLLPEDFRKEPDKTINAVAYVAGMTDRFAFEQAAELLGWNKSSLPIGIGRGA